MRALNLTSSPSEIRIGAKLRSSRLAQNLTLEQLAKSTELTKGFISRIERDETMPSVPTLVQLCQALSLPIGALFEEPEIHHIPLETAPRINMGGTGADERLLTPRSAELVQVLRSTVEPHGTGGTELYTVNCDVESVHLISGDLTLRFANREIDLAAGDTTTFPGSTPHTWVAGAAGAEIMWILAPAAWSGAA
ncbi:helix-turn-helix domain-containing protein [Leucobacter denitrificans]|uniref:Helix-turn-helix domain-containing protein n=1 Tax=Leucobacter denitrificans TaxID=683042 RepID=A0A7G9S853_9MICO|nr:helix-turn-helix transcriptional regulator [Leucobacter denitrificans]QNN64028.1 helix-turn-helix domain-containing protein [Leucobacter denitrificans]